eukprot:COSAG02_NODE_22896_length_736_cov_1.401884_1_plen_45_part_10
MKTYRFCQKVDQFFYSMRLKLPRVLQYTVQARDVTTDLSRTSGRL